MVRPLSSRPCIAASIALSLCLSHAAVAGDVSAAQAAVFAFAPTTYQPARAPEHRHSERTGRIAGQSLTYAADVDEFPVGEDGKTFGLVTTFGYTRLPAGGDRPVVFLFNGGPGASSWSLHMEGLGPVVYDPAHDRFADNPDSLLDVADIVFIDPLGTGASAPFEGTDPQAAWSGDGDAKTIWQVVHQWLDIHHRRDASLFLLGESYGTARAAAMLHAATETDADHLEGVALLSLALGGPTDASLQARGREPSMAATAWYHHRGDVADTSGLAAYERAATHATATEGLPEATTFREHLLADQGRIVGNLDTRVTSDSTLKPLPQPYSDPGMSLGKRPTTAMARYLASLDYRPPVAYRMLNLTINRTWHFNVPPDRWPFVGYLADAMRSQSRLRLFTAGGIYDLNTPAFAGTLSLRQAGMPKDRWTDKVYPAGHTIGEDLSQRPVLAADLRRFIGGH
ncbi:MAG: hypothetical protein ABWZ54_08990 [Luteibacter sp.]